MFRGAGRFKTSRALNKQLNIGGMLEAATYRDLLTFCQLTVVRFNAIEILRL